MFSWATSKRLITCLEDPRAPLRTPGLEFIQNSYFITLKNQESGTQLQSLNIKRFKCAFFNDEIKNNHLK